MASSKSRATLYATTSRAKQIEAEYLQSLHSEDLAFSTSNKKKDAERKRELRRKQRLKELAEGEERKRQKDQQRDERNLKRVLEEEERMMYASRQHMLREETEQKTIEEILYCQQVHQRCYKKNRTVEDIRGLLLQFQGNQPSRTEHIHDLLIAHLHHIRVEDLHALVRWRQKQIQTL